ADAYRLGTIGKRSVDRIGEQVDKHLLQLIWVGVEHHGRSSIHLDRHALLEKGNSFEKRTRWGLLQMRRGKLGQQPVRLHKSMQRICAALDNAKTSSEIANCGLIGRDGLSARKKTAGYGLYGSQRIRQLMAEYANQALPCDLLLFLQWLTHIGKQQQGV